MKWSVIGLVAVGLVSATCVAILVASIPSGTRVVAVEPAEVCFVQAAGLIEQGTVVTADHVTARTAHKGHEPENAFKDQGQVIGKTLAVSMSKGQAFTRACFPTEGAGLELASRLPSGMRAVSIEISDGFGMRGLLYPGGSVDVLVSFRASNDDEAISKTLLEEVQVLAVDSRTVSSPEEQDTPHAKTRNMIVTILVSAEQAQQLQLAVRHGTLSLAMRNPRDNTEAVRTSTRLGTLLDRKKKTPKPPVVPKVKIVEVKPAKDKVVAASSEPLWRVNVTHGQKTKEVDFSFPK